MPGQPTRRPLLLSPFAAKTPLLGAFDPRTLSGLQLYLRADLGVMRSGPAVTAWADQSGNGRDATQGVLNAQPRYAINVHHGKPVLRFGGSAALSLPSDPLGANWSVFIVFSIATMSGSPTFLDSRNSTTGASSGVIFAPTFLYPQGYVQDGTHGGESVVASGALVTSTPYLAIATNAAGNPITVAVNTDTPATSTGATVGAYTTDTWAIGNTTGFNQYLVGDLYALLTYNRVLTTTENHAVRDALNGFYALY